MSKAKVIARMTMKRKDGKADIVEVHEDATYRKFYHWYTREGRKNKVELSALDYQSRRDYMSTTMREPSGLEIIAKKAEYFFFPSNGGKGALLKYEEIKIVVYKKRLYKKLTTCPRADIDPDVRVLCAAPHEYRPGERPAKPLYPSTTFVVHTRERERKLIGLGSR